MTRDRDNQTLKFCGNNLWLGFPKKKESIKCIRKASIIAQQLNVSCHYAKMAILKDGCSDCEEGEHMETSFTLSYSSKNHRSSSFGQHTTMVISSVLTIGAFLSLCSRHRGLRFKNFMFVTAAAIMGFNSLYCGFSFMDAPLDVADITSPIAPLMHATKTPKCGAVFGKPPVALMNILDLIDNNAESVPTHRFTYNTKNHIGKEEFCSPRNPISRLLTKQSCIYDILNRWNDFAKKLNVRWVLHGGASMGAKCFGAMSPWDDDVDLTVLDCKPLDESWEKGQRVPTVYPNLDNRSYSMNNSAVIWDARLIEMNGDNVILSRGTGCCNWYKLMTVEEASMWIPNDQIGGIDIECMSRELSQRERRTMKKSNWTEYLKGSGELYEVPFGPTTANLMEPTILNHYILLRYGKASPCQYPFANGVDEEKFPPVLQKTYHNKSIDVFQLDQDQASMNFVVENWYVEKSQRDQWLSKKGDGNQMEYTKQIPNLDKIEIDNSISKGCTWQDGKSQKPTIKVLGWNAERGGYYDKFYNLIQEKKELQEPLVILLNEMDIGMARSGNVHTARRLALQLGMNYAFGVEFLELTSGTEEEHNATEGKRDALSLHGNAILSKCILGDTMIIRDALPRTYFSDKAEKGINANGYEVRLGGRMGLFARIFELPSSDIQEIRDLKSHIHTIEDLPPHFVVGNIHKLNENAKTRDALWDYYGFGSPPTNSTSLYDGRGVDIAPKQHGVIVQGDFGPQFCALGGLGKMNNYKIHKTFRVECLPHGEVKIGPLSGDFFCSNMGASRDVLVTAPCDWSNDTHPLTMADHAIVSIEVVGNKN